MIQKTKTDTTIENIHETRREISDRFGGDIAAISADAEERAKKSDWPVWAPPATDSERANGSKR